MAGMCMCLLLFVALCIRDVCSCSHTPLAVRVVSSDASDTDHEGYVVEHGPGWCMVSGQLKKQAKVPCGGN